MMRRAKWCFGPICLISMMLIACGGSDQSTGQPAEPATKSSASANTVTTEQDSFMAQMASQLGGIDAGIAAIEKKVGELNGPARQSAQPLLNELQEQRDTVQKNLDAMSTADGQAWKDLKIKMQSALFKLMRTYDQADKNI